MIHRCVAIAYHVFRCEGCPGGAVLSLSEAIAHVARRQFQAGKPA